MTDITFFTICYNEEILLPKFIKFYRDRFPNCKIIIYDNESTDSSVDIANKNGCEVITYKTNNQICDKTYLEIKNNVWKKSTTKWSFIGDVDELCDININDLIDEDLNNTSHIKFYGYDMVNMSNDPINIDVDLKYGYHNPMYNKTLFINTEKLKEIQYNPGCHTCQPKGELKPQLKTYNLYHIKYIGEKYLIDRYRMFSIRLSENNRRFNWGSQYLENDETIKFNLKLLRDKSIKLL